MIALIGQANILELPLVAKASGNSITSGTVNFYLRDKDGPNVGKWYRGSDQTWQSAISIAGVATHSDDGHWYLSFPSAVWTKNIRYRLYAKESGSLHITTGEDVLGVEKSELALHTDLDSYTNKNDWKAAVSGTGTSIVNYYIYTNEELETGPIGDCKVWVTTDVSGLNIVASGFTDNFGKITFYLDPGTYYMWRKKTGYNFTNPDIEVVVQEC